MEIEYENEKIIHNPGDGISFYRHTKGVLITHFFETS
jgi:hypothetical protein